MADEKKQLARIWVKAGDPNKVGVWERDTQHPNGEVFVSGEQAKEVAATPLVNLQLQNGSLVRASGPGPGGSREESDDSKPGIRRSKPENP